MLSRIEITILGRVETRPSWIRSLQRVKPSMDRLVRLGLMERIRPPNGTARNMVQITGAGLDALDDARLADWMAEHGGSVEEAATALGLNVVDVAERWAAIERAIGAQAA